MIKILELNFGNVKVYDKFLVSELKEGVLFDVESNRKLLQIGSEEFKGKPYGYISNRINSYAVNPMVYRESAEHENLKAIAVVAPTEIGRKSATVERNFYKDKSCFAIFATFEEARDWINLTIKD
ncbi:MAG TPA: hypothetical protein VFM59_00020 [Salinimicrobium sp.]|nr:hypothetical protein [Salinimicrobium sp.]